jgi:hypothetical protein
MENKNSTNISQISEKEFSKIVKNSPTLQKHFSKTREILSRIPKHEWDKVLRK